jgi:hypothetical protein
LQAKTVSTGWLEGESVAALTASVSATPFWRSRALYLPVKCPRAPYKHVVFMVVRAFDKKQKGI